MLSTRKLSLLGSLAFVTVVMAACRTTATSATKDIPTNSEIAAMSLDDFVATCQKQLADPNDGPLTQQLLQQYAQTTDCKTAYPIIEALIANSANAGQGS